MSARHSFLSFLIVGLWPLAALAQAPANDTCLGAQVLTFNNGLATSSIVRNIANATVAPEQAMSCGSSPKNTVWFTFTAPATGTYAFDTCGLATYVNAVAIYSGTCASLTQVTGGCGLSSTTTCARVSTQGLDAGAGQGSNLIAGTQYYVQVAQSGTVALNETSQVSLRVGLETAPANDTCSGTLPALQLNQPQWVSTRAANTTIATNDAELPLDGGCLQPGGTNHTVVNASGPDVAMRFTPQTSGDYSFRINQATVTSPNAVIYLTDTCIAGAPPTTYGGNQCIAAANRGLTGASGTEELSCLPLTAGTDYTLWVDSAATNTTGSAYSAVVTACFRESELNDVVGRANELSCPLTGNFAPAGDVDFYSVGEYPGARLFAMVEMNASSVTDSELRVTTATDTIQYDDDDGTTDMGSSGSVVAGVTLPAAPVYLRANYASATTQAGPYRLHSMLKFGAPTPEVEPNDTRAQANDLGLYVSGELETTSSIDIFSFEAREGELVFVALDGVPGRTGAAGANHNFEIFDALGWSVGIANDGATTTSNTASPNNLVGTTPTAPAEGYAFRASTTGRHYVHVTRSGSNPNPAYVLAISINCGMVRPTLTSVTMADGGTPATGSITGGDTLTLTGSGFDRSSVVRIGSTRATVVNVTNSQLTVTTPTSAEGTFDVSVTNFGNLTSTLPQSFVYFTPIAPPTVTSVTPSFGPLTGGTLVTVVGTLFKTGAEVTFTVGGTTLPATSVVLTNANQLTCRTPALPAGPATVTVRNPADDLSGSLPGAYTYVAPPTVTSVTPPTGLTLGGFPVTIAGTGFLPGATVRFGTVAATGVVVASDGLSVTANVPATLLAGPVAITIRNTDGQQVIASNAFTYVYPAPTLATVSPATGHASGGQVIVLTGSGFLSAPSPTVTFDGVEAPSVSRTSATELRVLTPPGAPGPADVVVINKDGQTASRAASFTYVPAPDVLSVTPARGPVQGGTRLTISGANFLVGARVSIGGVPAFAPTVVDANTISVVSNSGMVGSADVMVVNPDQQADTLVGGFAYDPAPSIANLSPNSGTNAGGTVVTLTGVGFRAGATVQFGTLAATAVTVVSDTQLTATTPASPLGVVTVRVTNDDGQAMSLPRAFRFVAPPTLTAISPSSGDVNGGTVVRVTGTNFAALTTVTFGGVPAQRVAFVDATELEAVSPPHAPGAVDVTVLNDNGDMATLAGAFRYTRAAPTISSLAPASGLTTGGVQVNVVGTNFAPTSTVTFGGTPATGVVMASPELLRVIAPAHAAGAVDVVVTNDDAQTATLSGGFTYVQPADGELNVVRDGGDGSLEDASAVDAGMGPNPGGGGGCGCSSVDATAMLALGALLLRRRRG